jgi:hypothetical protein
MTISGWVGVDLDGCLAKYGEWTGQVGEPIPDMVGRVRGWLDAGIEVRIFTARVGTGAGYSENSGRYDDQQFADEQREIIQAWCLEHIGQVLEVTAIKDFRMIELWDDRAVAVEMNTGRILGGASRI